MYPKNLDPSQLVALHFLLEERSVSQAAVRMSISQSSMSHRLARLRRELGDPLFVRDGRSLVATRRAEAMAVPLAAAMRSLEEALAPQEEFSPRNLTGPFSLYVPDLLAPLLPTIVRSLRSEAPALELEVQMVSPKLVEVLGGKRAAVALAPTAFATPQLMSRRIGTLEFGVVARGGHPALQHKLTVKRWLEFGHVVVEIGNDSKNLIEETLRKKRLKRDVVMRVPSFLTGLVTVASSDYLMNAPRSLVLESMKSLRLQVCPAPLPLPRVTFSMLWHERHQTDPAHEWLRRHIRTIVEPILAGRELQRN
jgi:DNA-binding transcriptional LysR family regulator